MSDKKGKRKKSAATAAADASEEAVTLHARAAEEEFLSGGTSDFSSSSSSAMDSEMRGRREEEQEEEGGLEEMALASNADAGKSHRRADEGDEEEMVPGEEFARLVKRQRSGTSSSAGDMSFLLEPASVGVPVGKPGKPSRASSLALEANGAANKFSPPGTPTLATGTGTGATTTAGSRQVKLQTFWVNEPSGLIAIAHAPDAASAIELIDAQLGKLGEPTHAQRPYTPHDLNPTRPSALLLSFGDANMRIAAAAPQPQQQRQRSALPPNGIPDVDMLPASRQQQQRPDPNGPAAREALRVASLSAVRRVKPALPVFGGALEKSAAAAKQSSMEASIGSYGQRPVPWATGF